MAVRMFVALFLMIAAPALAFGQGALAATDINAKLKDAATAIAGRLAVPPDVGELVLPADYFQKAFGTQVQIPEELGGGAMSLFDAQRILLVADLTAKSMLEVSGQNLATEADYRDAWHKARPTLLEAIKKVPTTKNYSFMYGEFLKQWELDVVAVQPIRFRDALRQAAYSIMRVSIEKEQQWINSVRAGRIATSTPSAARTSTGSTTLSAGGHWHIFWTRRILHHYRKH